MNAPQTFTADAPRLRGALASIIADPDCCAASKAIARDALTYHVNSAIADDMSCAETGDLHIRSMMSAALNGQFDGLPLTLFSKLDWIDAAQWLADVGGEPMDEAQAVAEIEMMLAKSDYFDRWQHLPEARQNAWAGCFESYFDASRSEWAA